MAKLIKVVTTSTRTSPIEGEFTNEKLQWLVDRELRLLRESGYNAWSKSFRFDIPLSGQCDVATIKASRPQVPGTAHETVVEISVEDDDA